jgi:WD40 repeat protein
MFHILMLLFLFLLLFLLMLIVKLIPFFFVGLFSSHTQGHKASVSCCVFHPTDPRIVLSASKDKSVIVWKDGAKHYTWQAHDKPLNSCSFSPGNVIGGEH